LGTTINLDRVRLFNYLRLILFASVLIYYFRPIADLFYNFDRAVIPLAKNHFHFVRPVGVMGESDVCDFTTFYASGLLNRERLTKYHNIDVYDAILLTQTVDRLIAPMRTIEVYSIQYPPMLFALTTPLSYFDLYTAWRIWFFASAICLAIAFLCIASSALQTRPLLLSGLFICFANVAVIQDLIVGQTTTFEAAIIAISLRLLINRNYFLAGLIAGTSFFKLQQALIILIPGFCLGRSKFFYGCFLSVIFEGLLSTYIVGYNNVLNFIETNYLSEITHSYVGLNEICSMANFRAMLHSLPGDISHASTISALVYILCCIASIWLWVKLYPALQKVSGQAFELIASVSTIALVYFSMHGYLYDYLLMIVPALWLYIWSTTDDNRYTTWQSIIRLLIALLTFALPFLILTNVDLMHAESTDVGYELRFFFGTIIFLFFAIAAIFIEFKQDKRKALVSK